MSRLPIFVILSTLVSVGCVCDSWSQESPGSYDASIAKLGSHGEILWERLLGDRGSDAARTAVNGSREDCFVGGHRETFGGNGWNAWVARIDDGGTVDWERTWDLPGTEAVFSLVESPSGVYLTGFRGSAGDCRIWVALLSTSGEMVWERLFGDSGYHIGMDLSATDDGGCVVVGVTSEEDAGSTDIRLIRLTSGGTVVFDRTFGGEDDEEAASVVAVDDGGFVVAGGCRSQQGDSNVLLVKFDRHGEVLWDRKHVSEGSQKVNSVESVWDDGLLVAGTLSPPGSGYGGENAWLGVFSSEGDVERIKVFRQKGSAFYDAHEYMDGGLIAAGSTRARGAGKDDIWIVILDRLWRVIEEKVYGGSGVDVLYDIEPTRDSGFIAAGFRKHWE